MTSRELVEEWKSIAGEGTFVHSEIEKFIEESSIPTHNKSVPGTDWLESNLINQSHIQLFPEVIVFSKELELAGTIDLIIFDEKTNEYKIIDWKCKQK